MTEVMDKADTARTTTPVSRIRPSSPKSQMRGGGGCGPATLCMHTLGPQLRVLLVVERDVLRAGAQTRGYEGRLLSRDGSPNDLEAEAGAHVHLLAVIVGVLKGADLLEQVPPHLLDALVRLAAHGAQLSRKLQERFTSKADFVAAMSRSPTDSE